MSEYRFLRLPVTAIPLRIERRLVRELERKDLWEGTLEWCRLIERSTAEPIEINIWLICSGWHLVGFAILQKVALSLSTLLRGKVPLPGWLERASTVTLGILDLPFQFAEGFISFGEQSQKGIYELLQAYVREVRRAERIDVLLVNASTQTLLEKALRSLFFVRSAGNHRSYLNNTYTSYDDYIAKQSRRKRETIRRLERIFAKGDISAEMVENPRAVDAVLDRVNQLCRSVAARKLNRNPISLSDRYFSEFIRQRRLRPFFMFYWRGGILIGCCAYMRSRRRLSIRQVGFDRTLNRSFKIYHHMMYYGLRHGFDNGYSQVECGVAKNAFKETFLRCVFVESHYWVRAWGIYWFGLPLLQVAEVAWWCRRRFREMLGR